MTLQSVHSLVCRVVIIYSAFKLKHMLMLLLEILLDIYFLCPTVGKLEFIRLEN